MAADNRWLIVGISGVTCGGKTTLATQIQDTFSQTVVLNQDAYFYLEGSPQHVKVPGMDHTNYDVITSLDMNKMLQDIIKLISKDHSDSRNILVLEGFCLLNFKPIADLCKLKYEISVTKDECVRRRMARVYDPPDVPGYFEVCVWPEYLKFHEDLKKQTDIIHIDGTEENFFKRVIADIEESLKYLS